MAPKSFAAAHWPALAIGLLGLVGFLMLRTEIRSQNRRIEELVRLQDGSESRGEAPVPPLGPPAEETLPEAAEPSIDAAPETPSASDWIECRGVANKTSIQSLLQGRGRAIHGCYEARARQQPDLAGGVLLELKVDREGRVVGTRTGGSLRDEQVVTCMAAAVKSFRFAPPAGDGCAVVSLPFAFGPRPDPER